MVGKELLDLYADDRYTMRRLPGPALRPYQVTAFERMITDLDSTGRALLILATGLGKTVVGGEVIARHLAANQRPRSWSRPQRSLWRSSSNGRCGGTSPRPSAPTCSRVTTRATTCVA